MTRILEVRRHSIRSKPSQELTSHGKTLAVKAAESLSQVDQVLVSELGRGANSATAMGHDTFEKVAGLGEIDEALIRLISWPSPLSHISNVCRINERCHAYSEAQKRLWQECIECLPESTNTLLISHGGIMELGLIACVPEEDFSTIGEVFAYCEGFGLSFANGNWALESIFRLEPDLRIVNSV